MKKLLLLLLLSYFSTELFAKTVSNWRLNHVYKKVSKKTNINKKALKNAFAFYKKNQKKKKLSSKYLAIADYTKSAKHKRLYIINLQKGSVYRYKIAHGKYSGSIGGKVRKSSNKRNSKMTPYGFFKVGTKVGRTKKKNYRYLNVQGLQWSNKKVGYPSRKGGRDVIIHPAKYVNRGGRSHGCFAIRPQDKKNVFAKLKKALLYSYTGR
ncbi:MAG: Unknown protein [uncultured Sulfurovum sp.]|uniref:L,D-TPase catalytic domain-containing protein n=1 Tax=uncultured Sulfurovum sp. TaxID=269237 RepID=A0A6S6TJ64_9BACT|nr:MAG: Unknown protein [uncultured Sulfurovum sp.]